MKNEGILEAEKEPQDGLKRVIMEIEPNNHNRFKAACNIRGLTMREVIAEFMEKFADETFSRKGTGDNEQE